jgi:chorismate-pyruvate lyase
MQSVYASDPLSLPILSKYLNNCAGKCKLVDPSEIPQPYQSLLNHSSNMTSTLCTHFRTNQLNLHVLQSSMISENVLGRLVVLKNVDFPVEFGAIEIHLDSVPEEIRKEILRQEKPLGQILREGCVDQECHPQSFFSIDADSALLERLEFPSDSRCVLYGRMNLISTGGIQRNILAQVVEILPNI